MLTGRQHSVSPERQHVPPLQSTPQDNTLKISPCAACLPVVICSCALQMRGKLSSTSVLIANTSTRQTLELSFLTCDFCTARGCNLYVNLPFPISVICVNL